MNTVLKFQTILLLLIVLIISTPVGVMAQPGFDPGVPDGAPVDGGLSMLVVAGVIYGTNKFLGKRKKGHEGEEKDQVEK